MTTQDPIALRVNLRIDLASDDNAPEPALLMSAAPDWMMVRMTHAKRVGETMRLIAEPNLSESFAFTVRVASCIRRLIPSQNLDYFEMKAELLENGGGYRQFLASARRTARELKEDVRLILTAPVDITVAARRFRSRLENVSYGGLFIVSDGSIRMLTGDHLDIAVFMPEQDSPIELAGHVVYTMNQEQAERMGAQAGVGVQLALNDEQNVRWEAVVRDLHRRVVGE
jgi:hypothetical protein